ncbi:thioredoxin domain-containing protein [Acidocella sp. KAb 2-4]|uniref:thioredoxin domain-containing protein n=1 Tax=Acidocella sp. KAb 2-4 TaxID=2885158 RepID=UPI001D095913|nr:thioredoxin domain-containing protein [Acidocella sp. KAb 2-4]MCB5944032.1 thioredoxin family protein [Acidocella sp. KAb 2-4]
MTALTLVCPACGTLNRVPAAKLADGPICGACRKKLFTGQPQAVDEAGLARHVAHDGIPVLVDVWANWCGPCRAMAPQFAQTAALLEPRARLLKLDADTAPETMARYGIRSIPTLMLFSGGKLAAQQAGAMAAAQIVQWTRPFLSP